VTGERPTNSGRGVRIAIVVAVLAIVYALVLVLYARSGHVTSPGTREPEPDSGGVTVALTVTGVDTAEQRTDMSVRVDPSQELFSGDGVSLTRDIHVLVSPVDGSPTLDFPPQSVGSTQQISVSTAGDIENWPFDSYRTGALTVLAYVSSDGILEPLPTKIWITGYVPGWNISVTQNGTAPGQLPATLAEAVALSPHSSLTATRSGSTIAFAFLLLALLAIMPCLVLFVAISTFRGRRRVEATLLSWIGAMLFATIPLRGFLPGAPPIGSWIDFAVVLWVVVGLIAGLAIYVAAWARWSSPGPTPVAQSHRPPADRGADEL
jgi:hypothetical protein